jgi:signal transduction histidine kinase
VIVRDTGIGIPEEEQAKVFSRFYRSVKTASQEGVGIGLYLSREILAEEGGYLKLMSKPGTGSVFSAYFPRSISASGDSMSKNSDGKYTGIGDLE